MDTGKDGYAALSTNDAGPGYSPDESKPPVRVVRKCGLLWYGVTQEAGRLLSSMIHHKTMVLRSVLHVRSLSMASHTMMPHCDYPGKKLNAIVRTVLVQTLGDRSRVP